MTDNKQPAKRVKLGDVANREMQSSKNLELSQETAANETSFLTDSPITSNTVLKDFTAPDVPFRSMNVGFPCSSDKPLVRVFTDGSSLGNGKSMAAAGFGVYFGPSDPRYWHRLSRVIRI